MGGEVPPPLASGAFRGSPLAAELSAWSVGVTQENAQASIWELAADHGVRETDSRVDLQLGRHDEWWRATETNGLSGVWGWGNYVRSEVEKDGSGSAAFSIFIITPNRSFFFSWIQKKKETQRERTKAEGSRRAFRVGQWNDKWRTQIAQHRTYNKILPARRARTGWRSDQRRGRGKGRKINEEEMVLDAAAEWSAVLLNEKSKWWRGSVGGGGNTRRIIESLAAGDTRFG